MGDHSTVGPWGIYVHVPWCRARCSYCAFEIIESQSPPETGPFLARIAEEHAQHRPKFGASPTTVYLGGGTPSRLHANDLTRLLHRLVEEASEVTVEANPEDLTREWIDAVQRAGVNRISLGVQSWVRRHAKRLGRAHTHKASWLATEMLAEAGLQSWSVDLIFGMPQQSLQDLDADLDALFRASPPHVAIYGLTYEPGTPLTRLVDRGRMEPLDEDRWCDLHDHLVNRMEREGFERYEISNFARPGHRSRHNQLYWNDAPYLGLGPSAHGYLPDGSRTINPPMSAWLLGTQQIETPDARERAVDLLISMLRRKEGLDLRHLSQATGCTISEEALSICSRGGLIVIENDHAILTKAGIRVSDAVTARLADGLMG